MKCYENAIMNWIITQGCFLIVVTAKNPVFENTTFRPEGWNSLYFAHIWIVAAYVIVCHNVFNHRDTFTFFICVQIE